MEICYQTDVGKRRNTNQDYAGVFSDENHRTLAILADGMGGHQAGDVASKQTVEDLGLAWQTANLNTPEQAIAWLEEHIQKENEVIYQNGQAQAELAGMGTTLVAMALFEQQFALAHVGDSRAYVLRQGEFIQLTEDHSLVNELVLSGEITPEMALNHPRKNILTRSVGMPGTVKVDVITHFMEAHDIFLLASDGLTNMVSPAEISNILSEKRPLKDKVKQLITTANEAGGVDNITALVIDLGGPVNA
ncbi:MAG: Stp1/IreP family PP2C-type Ser/Thr phosphatase [Enterococcus sp.]